VTFRVEEQVGGLEVAVDEFTRVELLEGLEQLIDDLLLVDVFEDVGADDCVQVSLHLVEHALDVLVVLGADDVEQPHNVLVAVQLLQEHDFALGALGVSRVLESVEDFLECDDFVVGLLLGLPHDPVCSFPQLLNDLILLQHFFIDMF